MYRLHRLLSRVCRALAAIATVSSWSSIALFLFNDVVVDGFRDWANEAFGTADDGTAEGVEQPETPLVSGARSRRGVGNARCPGSTWVASSTPTDMISEFQASIGNADADVIEPIRVFAGIKSADDVQDRADLA